MTTPCCGNSIRDNADENVDHDAVERLGFQPHDNGYGMCRGCGGDDRVKAKPKKGRKAKPLTEAAVRKRLGFAACAFVDARLDVLEKRLNEANRAKLATMTYERKVSLVHDLVEKGAMV